MVTLCISAADAANEQKTSKNIDMDKILIFNNLTDQDLAKIANQELKKIMKVDLCDDL